MRSVDVTAGLLATLVVHAALVTTFWFADGVRQSDARVVPAKGSFGYGLCGQRRCPVPEADRRRWGPEPDPASEPQVLEAALMPALGSAEPEPTELPELQTYEQAEAVEEQVNLEKEAKPKEPVRKAPKPEPARRDPDNPKDLDDILKDFEEDDPRKRATRLDEIVGHEEGEVGGQGAEARAGNLYAARVARSMRKAFELPHHVDAQAAKGLRVQVRVTRMSPEGAIRSWSVISKSGNRGFDDAAIDAVRAFVPAEGGSRTLPRPDSDVLRWINSKGMKIDLDGRYMSR